MFENAFRLTAIAAASLCLLALGACSGSGGDTSASNSSLSSVASAQAVGRTVDPAINDVEVSDSGPMLDPKVKAASAAATTVDSTFAAYGEQWYPLRTQSLAVVPGSALDFSTALANYNSKSMCAAWMLPTAPMPSTAASASATVDELQRRGFNFVRLHLVEAGLMTVNATSNVQIDASKLDRLWRMVAELSKRNMGYSIDIISSANGYMAGGGTDNESATSQGDAKTLINTSDAFRSNWKTAVNKILGTTNPYLGKPMIKDTNLKMIVGVNENPMAFIAGFSGVFPSAYKPLWNNWLKTKYGTDTAWRTAWAKVSIGSTESLSNATINMPSYSSSKTQREADFAAFIAATEKATTTWQMNYLASLGYTGTYSQYNVRNSWMEAESRMPLSAISFNTYNDHPSAYGIGGSIKHTSLFDSMFGYMTKAAMLNQYGKPLYLTETSDVYWNKYRHEAGAVVGAIAAHQDWQGLCSFAYLTDATSYDTNAYYEHLRSMKSFMVWGDPINVANDRIATMLFRRGDVSKARYKVAYTLRPDEMNNYKYGATWMMSYSGHFLKRALVNGVELIDPSLTDGNKNWLGAAADKPAEIREPHRVADDLTPTVRAAYQGTSDPTWYEMAARIRETGKVDSSNKTDAPNGIIQSDTNQIYYDIPNQLIDIATPRSEVIVMGERSIAKQDFMNVSRSTPRVTIAAMSLDGADLVNSKRILLVHLSNVKGTNMKFADSAETTISDWGTFPMLVRGAKSDIQLKLNPTAGWKLYALDLSGKRISQMWTGSVSGRLGVSLETNNQWIGPVFYYELVRE